MSEVPTTTIRSVILEGLSGLSIKSGYDLLWQNATKQNQQTGNTLYVLKQTLSFLMKCAELSEKKCSKIRCCCCCSVTQLCLTLCNPMDCRTPGLPVPHCLLESAKVHVHCLRDAMIAALFPSIRDFSNESSVCIRWPKYGGFSFIISPSREYSGLISLKIDWLDLLAAQETFRSLFQHHSSKALIIWCSAFFTAKSQERQYQRTCYQTIAFISHASEVMLKILHAARLQHYVNQELPVVQAGFRKGRGTRDQIATIHWIIEKAREFQKNIYLCFINYAKSFYHVDHDSLWKTLREMRIPEYLICLLRNLYAGQEVTVRTLFDNWLVQDQERSTTSTVTLFV